MASLQHKEAGNNFFKEGKWKEAMAEYTAGLEESGDSLPRDQRGVLLSNRSQCWLKLCDYQRSFDDANECLKLMPEHTKSLFRRASAAEKLGRSAEALADFARVARAEPQNKAAVEGAQRLRDKVYKENQRLTDEALPSNLLDVLRAPKDGSRDAESSVEDQIQACGKLRTLCLRHEKTSLLASAGALQLLLDRAVDASTAADLRQACLACLVTMASGSEDSIEAWSEKHEGTLPVSAAAADVRKQLHVTFKSPSEQFLSRLNCVCREHAGSMRQLAILLGLCHEPEDEEALEVLHTSIAFVEGSGVDVPRAGITALVAIFDTRRRLGQLGKPVVPNRPLMKCLESALGTTGCSELLQACFAEVFSLMADEDRPQNMKVDLSDVGRQVLEPFIQSQDVNLRSNALAGLSCLLAANSKAAARLLQNSQCFVAAILGAISQPIPGLSGREAQHHAAECLLLAIHDPGLRQQWINGGGIDVLLTAVNDTETGTSRGLIHAKLVGVLSIVSAHSKEVRDEVFERIDLMMELRHALETARDSASSARGRERDKLRKLSIGLYESCSCLSIHGEFKELLFRSKKTMGAMLQLASAEDLSKDPALAFHFASMLYNWCRSRDDKVRAKTGNSMIDDLGDDEMKALEEFHQKMPAEARPATNGDVDSGSKELASSLQAWCVQQSESGGSGPRAGGSLAVHKLGKCIVKGSPQTHNLVAFTMKLLCSEVSHRKFVVAAGGVRALLQLVDLKEEKARDAARQSLAQICIVTNPAVLEYREQLDAVRPLTELLEHRHELLQFEAAMGLTNLLSGSDELRTRAIQADAWSKCRELVFSENEQVQRAGLEAMCNFTMAPEILERFADGRAELELRVMGSFCNADDPAAQVAASGALAMLASCPEVALKIATHESCYEGLLQAVLESNNPAVQHRAVAAICSILDVEGCPEKNAKEGNVVLQERLKNRGGFVSAEATQLAQAAVS